ncbi:uncharacterized protein LOC143858110 [Tasmannia lanceolata]|uniref:uncharacterized protein LOC143858110 n=1 Tax=Tasmannia lanceolata TaxID=3420 RepID=UPI0040630B68
MLQMKEMNVGFGSHKLNPAYFDNQLVIKLPDGRILRVIARSLLLAILILALPWFCSLLGSSESNYAESYPYQMNDLFFLPMLFQDMGNKGLIKSGDRVLFMGDGDGDSASRLGLQIMEVNEIDLISERDSGRQSSIPDETFDFAYAEGFRAGEFIDRTLKIGGIAVVRLGTNPSDSFRVPPNFKIAYLRRFDSTVVGMRKIGRAAAGQSPTRRRLCAFGEEDAKKVALKGLEDVLLEPRRSSSMESNYYLKRTKYLPDLTGDSLEGYPRRVFIDAGERKHGDWFERHYPTRNRDFDIYKVETVAEGGALGMSEWMRRNVKQEEFVVMQAEAEVVEEMVKSKAICLVDELFLECKHQGQKGKKTSKSKRAYWECLALYGKLRDQGVAVHQWWS